MNSFREWLDSTTRGASASEIADKTGFNRATVYRWRKGTVPPCEALFAVARTYDGDVIEGMMAAGYMTEDDFLRSIDGGLRRISTQRLRDEIRARETS